MDARRITAVAALLLVIPNLAASFRSENFIVSARTPAFARQVGETAERLRHDLAVQWLGAPLPRWSEPCPIQVNDGPQLGAGGQTSFAFDGGRPFGWEMIVQGTQQRILDSVLPHEITHTIFATHFGRPLPRWADEGACTTVEDIAERSKQHRLLINFLTNNRGIAFDKMFAMREYPRDILPLYAQGYSLARFLIQQGGHRKFVQFVGAGMDTNNWEQATKQHYSYEDLRELQNAWLAWVKQGSPLLSQPISAGLAVAQHDKSPAASSASKHSENRDNSDNSGAVPLAARPSPEKLVPVRLPRPKTLYTPGSTQRALVLSLPGLGKSGDPPAGTGSARQTARPQPYQSPQQSVHEWSAKSTRYRR